MSYGTPLRERILAMVASEVASRRDVREALAEKGVVAPDSMTVADIAGFIRRIASSEFEFLFNFRDVDQFGRPRKDRTGWATGGNVDYVPAMAEPVTCYVDFPAGEEPDVPAAVVNMYGDAGLPESAPLGAFGTWSSSPTLSAFAYEMADVSAAVLEAFWAVSSFSPSAVEPEPSPEPGPGGGADGSDWTTDGTNFTWGPGTKLRVSDTAVGGANGTYTWRDADECYCQPQNLDLGITFDGSTFTLNNWDVGESYSSDVLLGTNSWSGQSATVEWMLDE